MHTFVYFIEFVEVKVVKIGFSKHPIKRRAEIQGWVDPLPNGKPHTTRLLAQFPGDSELEAAFHYRFRNHLVHLREGFDAAWVKPFLATFTESGIPEILASYRARSEGPWPEEEATERFPQGFVWTSRTPERLERLLEFVDHWHHQIHRLQLTGETDRPPALRSSLLTFSKAVIRCFES